MTDAKKSLQSPQENQLIEQRHVGRAEEIQVSQLSQEKSDSASPPIYENRNTEQKKEKKHLQSQLSDSGHSQKQVYKTIIQTGPRSPTKKVEFSGMNIEENPYSHSAVKGGNSHIFTDQLNEPDYENVLVSPTSRRSPNLPAGNNMSTQDSSGIVPSFSLNNTPLLSGNTSTNISSEQKRKSFTLPQDLITRL